MRLLKSAALRCLGTVALTAAAMMPVSAEVLLPMMSESSITLGSGIVRGVEPEILPACFEVLPVRTDPNTIGKYSTRIYVVSNLEQLIRERRKAGSASASYGGLKAAVEGWSNTQQSEQQSALFVVIEAQFTGPRTMMNVVKPLPDVAELLKVGDALKIRERCGTHIATVQHHGQVVRIVINMTTQDRLLKEALQAKFSARGRYGLFKAQASANYSESMSKLAKSRQLEVRTEGTGEPPSSDEILKLLETKAGDLNAVAQQLGAILRTANVGKIDAQAITGYTIQPLGHYIPGIPKPNDTEDVLKAENQLREYLDMLSSQIDATNRMLAVSGIPQPERTALRTDLESDLKFRGDLKLDLDACPTAKSGSEKACDTLSGVWYERLAATRRSSAAIVAYKANPVGDNQLRIASAELSTNSKFRGFGYLIATIDGTDYALDPVKIDRGTTTLNFFAKVSDMMGTQPVFGVIGGMGVDVNSPRKSVLSSDVPLAANLALLMYGARNLPLPDFTRLLKEVQLGCYGGLTYGVNPRHRTFIEGAVQVTTTSKDSICVGIQPAPIPVLAGEISLPLYGYGIGTTPVPDAITLMPPAVKPIRFDFPTAPISLSLVTVDEFGFRTVHLLAADISTLVQVI